MDNRGNKKSKMQLKSYAVFLAWMTLLLVGVNILVYLREFYSGLLMTLGLIIYVFIIVLYYFLQKKKALSDLVDFTASYACLQNRLLEEFDLPYFLMDKDERLLWGNTLFYGLEKDKKIKAGRGNIKDIIPEITADKLPKVNGEVNFNITHGETVYKVNIRLLTGSSELELFTFPDIEKKDLEGIYAVTLFDETKLYEYMKKYQDETMVTSLLYLDNYEETLESVEEVSRSILTALIDRKINQYFTGYDCIVRKFEKDKYLVLMRTRSLQEMGEKKFSILEEIKSINTENEMAVTLSMGIGCNQGSYVKNLEAARVCIDLGLGRGGDQVVLKNKESIQYFGGKSQAVEKSTKVKARVKAHALHEFMAVCNQVIVMGHKMIDIDAFGASVGIYKAAHALNKKTHIVVDSVSATLEPFVEMFKNKGVYDEELLVTPEQAKNLIDENTLLVVVDTSRPGYTAAPELLSDTKNIVVFDHHRQSSDVIKESVLTYIEPYASSSCEMIAEILQYFTEEIRLKPQEADTIYAGMLIDTDNFAQKTGVRTFEAAAYLKRNGADVTRVRKMFRENMSDYLAKGEVIAGASLFKEHFAISVCPTEGVSQPTIVGAQAANELLNILGVTASFVLTLYNGTVYISARSIDEVNVQIIMERLGGGGHMNMAGAQMTGVSIEEAKDKLRNVISEMIREGEI